MPRSAKKRNSKTNLKRLSRKRKMSKTPKRKPRKMKGGGCKSCGGGAGLNANTFKNYMKGIEENLSGGGYTTNMNGVNIGNRAVHDFYADTNPPVSDLKGNLVIGKGSGPGCGQYGGESGDLVLDDLKQLSKMSKKSKKKSRKSKSRSRKSKSRSRKSKSRSKKSKSRSKKSKSRSKKKTKKQKRRKRRRRNKMKGGMVMHQKAAFEGPNGKSNFSGNMNDRMFKCSQPNWEPGCI